MASDNAGLSCPSGGSFYICAGNITEFIGCCASDPCTASRKGVCPTTDLRTSSFSADAYGSIAPQNCTSDAGLWYTCKLNIPPFLGCCSVNPCSTGSCSADDLVPAQLSTDAKDRALFLAAVSSVSSSSSIATSRTSATSAPAGTTATVTATGAANHKSGLGTDAIVGIAVGIASALILAAIAVFLLWRRNKGKRRQSINPELLHHQTGMKSPVSQTQHTASSTSPSISPEFVGGASPSVGGYMPQQQHQYTNGSAIPALMTDTLPQFSQSMMPSSPYVNNQYGYQSVSTLSRDHVQYHSGISRMSSSQPSPGFVPPYAQELDSTTRVIEPIVQTSPQEMPASVGQQLFPTSPTQGK